MGGGGGWAMNFFFLRTGFQWPTPGVAQKKLVTHAQPKPVTLMWIGTLGNIGLPLKGDLEKEPLKPTDRQAIHHKIKKLQH